MEEGTENRHRVEQSIQSRPCQTQVNWYSDRYTPQMPPHISSNYMEDLDKRIKDVLKRRPK